MTFVLWAMLLTRDHRGEALRIGNAVTSFSRLSGVTIDVCALKEGLDFKNETFRQLTKALGPGILRIGGTDQKSYTYDMESTTQEKCECKKSCVLSRNYFESLLDFCDATDCKLVFGLASEGSYAVSNASALMDVAGDRIFAYTFGNEQDTDVKDQKKKLKELQKAYPSAKFAAPDTPIGPIHDFTTPDLTADEKVQKNLKYLTDYTKENAEYLTAITWHTYDFRADAVNATEHGSLAFPPSDKNFTRWFDPAYLALFDQAYAAVDAATAMSDLPLWLSEFDSVCHQGVHNLTDAYANSLWLAHRFGAASKMPRLEYAGRQTLIGYEYALLNATTLRPYPDFYTTLLARRLLNSSNLTVLDVASDNPTLPTFGFCRSSDLVLLFVSLNETTALDVDLSLPRTDFLMTPHYPPDDCPRCALTSSDIDLNGHTLTVDDVLDDSDILRYGHDAVEDTLHLAPLTFAFSVIPASDHCRQQGSLSSSKHPSQQQQ